MNNYASSTNILVTTVPFGENDPLPLSLLSKSGLQYSLNPLNRKLKEDELSELIKDVEILIAGTEIISKKVINSASKLKLISRVGIGLDNVDLITARQNNIQVCYTPDAPTLAVSELTVGLIFNLLRGIHLANLELHNGHWKRYFGKRISTVTIGIIGFGRIGKAVYSALNSLGANKIIVNDVDKSVSETFGKSVQFCGKSKIFREADVISLHIPLTKNTRNLITMKEMKLMKNDVSLINTSRGGIVNEKDLLYFLEQNPLVNVALDVFDNEPYSGNLSQMKNCILTAHMGSMSIDCRNRMELEATEEVLRFVNDQQLSNPVPENEYKLQAEGNFI